MTPTPGDSGPIAILAVHGIGAQQAGETARKLLAGLARVDRNVESIAPDGSVTVGGQHVRVYEVYWADLLAGDATRGAFHFSELQSLSWFPWFNHRRSSYLRGQYSFPTLAWWCTVLPIFNFFALFAYYGAGLVAQIASWGKRRQPRSKVNNLWHAAKSAADETSKFTVVDTLLDEYVGDVFSYVNSAGAAFRREKDERPIPPAAEHAYQQIVQRFYDQLVKTQTDGCTAVHVVAHSLGTVVAYHALTGLRFDERRRTDDDAIRAAMRKVRRLYTIGSPLEKIRFFWPRLVPPGAVFPKPALVWDNFVSWFDPVAGILKRFDDWGQVSNHRLLGGGFVRGHVVYEHSPVFLGVLTQGLCGREIPLLRTRSEVWRDRFVLAGETVLTPAAVVLVLLLGMSVFVLAALLVPYLLSLALRMFLPEATWVSIQNMTALAFAGMMVLVFFLAPMIRASKVHRLHWTARSAQE